MIKHDEHSLQVNVVKTLRSKSWIVFAIPNERNQGLADTVRMRSSGVTKGAPDLVCWEPNGRCHFMELKTKIGTRSLEQKAMEDVANRLGIKYHLVRSVSDVENL
jgi:hypothetical protein